MQAGDRFDGVVDVAEAAGLVAIAEDDQWFVAERGFDEARQDHAVPSGLAGTDGVEKTGDDDGEFAFVVVSHGEEFVHELGTGVAPAAKRGRADEEIIIFGEGGFAALAIDFGSRSEENRSAGGGGGEKQDFGFLEIRFDGADGRLDDEFYTDRGGEVNDEARLGAEDREIGTI